MEITKELLLQEQINIIQYRDKALREVEQADGALKLVDFLLKKLEEE